LQETYYNEMKVEFSKVDDPNVKIFLVGDNIAEDKLIFERN